MGAPLMVYTNNKMEKVVMKINLNESADLLKIKKASTHLQLFKNSFESRTAIRKEN